MRSWRFAIAAVAALVACPSGQAQGPPTRAPAAPSRAVLRLGALLPLTGPGAWFGAEIKQGIDLALAELDPSPRTAPAGQGGTSDPRRDAGGRHAVQGRPRIRAAAPGQTRPAPGPPTPKRRSGPPPEPIEPRDRPRTVSIAFQALDVQPLDLKAAETEVNRLLTAGVAAIVTASPTPTLTVYPIAAARDALVLHAGLPTDRFPAASRTLFQLRPSLAARAEVLAAHAWEGGLRRPGSWPAVTVSAARSARRSPHAGGSSGGSWSTRRACPWRPATGGLGFGPSPGPRPKPSCWVTRAPRSGKRRPLSAMPATRAGSSRWTTTGQRSWREGARSTAP